MKLATGRDGTRDGRLLVVDRALARAVAVPAIAPTLQRALDDWSRCSPALQEVYAAARGRAVSGGRAVRIDRA